MDFKPKNRDWVKNAAIVFLAVLLVLTFFSNTIMNRSLPEVATQSVSSGSITAKVRGTGTVTAAGIHTVKADQTREIRAVMVKAGQEVSAGDVLFILGEGESAEIEQAQETLRSLQMSYQRAAAGIPYYSYAAEEHEIAKAKEELKAAENKVEQLQKFAPQELPLDQMAAAKQELIDARAEFAAATENLEQKKEVVALIDKIRTVQDALDEYEWLVGKLETELQDAIDFPEPMGRILELQEELENARKRLAEAQEKRKELGDPGISSADAEAALKDAQERYDDAETAVAAAIAKTEAIQAVIDEIMATSSEYKEAVAARKAAEETLYSLQTALEQKKIIDSRSQSLSYIDLSDLSQQIEKAKQKLADLSGGEENQITAKVSGTVQSVEVLAGETKAKGDVLANIEVPDMGYTLSFTVTNDQARRLKVGDSATVSNYYWGNSVKATLSSIRVDPKNPQTNKILSFDLEGDVNAGSELTISVGQKSANYDLIVPNSAIRSDANGKFVLKIESKSSPLGNRYIARRVNVEVLAEDDMNSAVTGDLQSWGEYVITTANAPVKSGDMVRLADNN